MNDSDRELKITPVKHDDGRIEFVDAFRENHLLISLHNEMNSEAVAMIIMDAFENVVKDIKNDSDVEGQSHFDFVDGDRT